MKRSFKEHQETRQQNAESLIACYVGKDLEKVGTHLPDKSSYNHNFYRMPNGTTVLLRNDDEGFNQVAVEMPNGELSWVGAQYDNGEFMLGSFW